MMRPSVSPCYYRSWTNGGINNAISQGSVHSRPACRHILAPNKSVHAVEIFRAHTRYLSCLRQFREPTPAAAAAFSNGESSGFSQLSEEFRGAQARRLPNQAETVFNPTDTAEDFIKRVPVTDVNTKSGSDLDYLTELMAIQHSDGPKAIGFFGTRNMGVTHQKLVEVLSYAYASTGNHIFTSGATGTNAAVIKGALRANAPDKLTVILPQSMSRQPSESQELLQQVQDLVEMPENDELSLLEASRICNRKIISHVQQIICFAFHDSRLLMETCHEAKDSKKIVTLFFLD